MTIPQSDHDISSGARAARDPGDPFRGPGWQRSSCFVIAGVSDGVDGYIARRFDMRSEFGAMIDPLADKALLITLFVTLAVVGENPDLDRRSSSSSVTP